MKVKDNHIKKSFTSGVFKKGSYSAGLSVIVIAVIIAVNLVASQLPDSVKSIDMTSQKYYTLSKSTKDILKKLDDKITIYQVANKGSEDKTISKLLKKYEDLTDKIEVKTLDPELNPGLVTSYEASDLSQNSLIVLNGDKKKLIDYSDIYETDYSAYYTTGTTSTSFDGEGEITSAINYVTTDELPKMYTLSGHDEQKFSQTISDALVKQNIEIDDLNLLATGEVPADCDILTILAPAKDCSKEEADSIISYLENGGKALIVMNYYFSGADTPNFGSVLDAYGVAMQTGYINEVDENYFFRQGYYLLPEVKEHDITSSFYNKMYIMAPISQGIEKLKGARETLKIEDLLTTTDSSYSDVDYGAEMAGDGTNTKSADDVNGPFSLAVAISEENGENTTKLVVYGSYIMFTDDIIGSYSLGNVDMLKNSVSWMCDLKTAGTVSIDSKSMDVPQNTIASGKANAWTLCFVVLIPLFVTGIGFTIWYRRRRA